MQTDSLFGTGPVIIRLISLRYIPEKCITPICRDDMPSAIL